MTGFFYKEPVLSILQIGNKSLYRKNKILEAKIETYFSQIKPIQVHVKQFFSGEYFKIVCPSLILCLNFSTFFI